MADTKMIQNIVANAENNSYEFDLVGEKVADVKALDLEVPTIKFIVEVFDSENNPITIIGEDDYEAAETRHDEYNNVDYVVYPRKNEALVPFDASSYGETVHMRVTGVPKDAVLETSNLDFVDADNHYFERLKVVFPVSNADKREMTITALETNKSVALFGEKYTDVYEIFANPYNGTVTAKLWMKSTMPFVRDFDTFVVKRDNFVIFDISRESDNNSGIDNIALGSSVLDSQTLGVPFTVEYSFKESAVGKDAFKIEGVDENNNVIANEEYPIEVVNHEGALVKYETLVANISDSDLATIEAQKPALDEAKTVARQAIDALEEGETKTAYNERFAVAEDNQNEGYKLLYLYKSKNSHFSLSKVKNVGGNVPFKIVFDDENLVGDSTEALYYAPNSNVAVDVKSGLVPSQNYIAFGSATIADGEHIYINKVGDNYYRTVVEVEEGQIAKINGTEIDASKIAEQGGSYTVPGKEVSKSALTDALAEANALNDAHVVGTEVGQVPQNQKDAFNQAIAKAQEVADDDDATTAKVNKAVEALNKAKEEFDSFIVDYTVDKTALAKAISDYTAVVETATVGSNVGETTQDNIDALTAAIATAQSAMDAVDNSENYDAEDEYDEDVQAIADALQALEDAKAEFDKHVVSTASYADAKLKLYEEAASRFLDSIRKKIRI